MPCTPLRSLFVALLAGFVLFVEPAAFSAEKRKPISAEEVGRLKRENEVLRSENQRLRKLLAESIARPPTAEEPATSPKPAKKSAASGGQAANEKETGFWLSEGEKRHNATCRYYRTSKGKPCGPNEGEACKVCGG